MSEGTPKREAAHGEWVTAGHAGDCAGPPSFDRPWCNHDAHWREKSTWKRANFLPAPHFYNLNQACHLINKAFSGGFGCYLVGSSLAKRDWRDVDVRLILEDGEYERLFRARGDSPGGGWLNPLWSLLCTSLSLWLKEQTGLPVDFQIQQQTNANAEHKGGKRSALGIFLDYPGERPTDVAQVAATSPPPETP
jgi:hypothetical protein